MVENTPEYFMGLAIGEAWKYQLLTYPNPAVGCAIVKDNKLLAIGVHQYAGGPHAEVNALKEVYLSLNPNSPLKNMEDSHKIHDFLKKNHNGFLETCEVYVSLEPCNHMGKTPACAVLLAQLKPKKVYLSVLDPNENASGGKKRLENAGIEVQTNILNEEGKNLLKPFSLWHRDKFVFFKIAMRRDGSVTGGYITTQDSLNLVHEIRTKIDLMVIGGNTVRADKPTLDSRFSKSKKASDILIYSRQKEFSKDIKLFSIPNREVKMSDKFEFCANFVMVEGGLKLLSHLKNKVHMLMIFISHRDKNLELIDLEQYLGLKKLHSYMVNSVDEVLFFG